MNDVGIKEFHFLLDSDGAVIAFQEKDQSWAGALAFSSEALANDFLRMSHLDAAEIATVEADDKENIAALVAALKKRPIRYLLLDLDYRSGNCRQIDFEGNSLGAITERRFTAAHDHD